MKRRESTGVHPYKDQMSPSFHGTPILSKMQKMGKDRSGCIFVSVSIGEDYEQHGDAVDAISLWFTAEILLRRGLKNLYLVRRDDILTLLPIFERSYKNIY